MTRNRLRLAITMAVLIVVIGVCWALWHALPRRAAPASSPATSDAPLVTADAPRGDDLAPTKLYAHNVMLHKGPDFRIYIRWVSGQMRRTRRDANPSFDDPGSFVLEIQKGVIHANIGDISNFLNGNLPADAPLKNVSIQPAGEQIKLRGTVHKVVSVPVELMGDLSATADGRVQFHVTRISVLKVPMKGLLGSFRIKLSDLVSSHAVPGVEVAGDNIVFDTLKLLPPPHIQGQLTAVRVRPPDLEVIYGNAPDDEHSLAQWHNFVRFRGGAVDFGKLTMHHADITMIDSSTDAWFDLDLVNYQAQLVNGFTRMTAQAGLEIFMPDIDETAPKKASNGVTLEWLKDRNRSLPDGVPAK